MTTTAIQIRYTRQPSTLGAKFTTIQVVSFNRHTVTNVDVRRTTDLFPYFA